MNGIRRVQALDSEPFLGREGHTYIHRVYTYILCIYIIAKLLPSRQREEKLLILTSKVMANSRRKNRHISFPYHAHQTNQITQFPSMLAPLPIVASWPAIPTTPLPKILSPQSLTLQQLTTIPQLLHLDLAVSSSLPPTSQCLAPSLREVIHSSSSSSIKRKAPLTRSPPSSIVKEAERRTRTTIPRLPASLRKSVNRAHLDTVAALAQGGGKEGNLDRVPKGARLRPTRGRSEEAGGEKWRKNMGVWNWRIRGVLPETTLLSVCLISFSFCYFCSVYWTLSLRLRCIWGALNSV